MPLVIIGAGGFGREILDIVHAMNIGHQLFDLLGFLDDRVLEMKPAGRRTVNVLGPVAHLEKIDTQYVIGIASPDARMEIDEFATAIGRMPASLVHPSATFGADVELGPGSIVCSHVSVTTNVRTGRHVHLHINSAIGHDVEAKDYVTVLPGATISGNVVLEQGATIGANSTVIQGLDIGHMAIVGAGAVVVRSVPSRMTVAGVPARPLHRTKT